MMQPLPLARPSRCRPSCRSGRCPFHRFRRAGKRNCPDHRCAWTTAGAIRAGGGTVEPVPELNPRVGQMNYQDVDVCLGEGAACQWTDLVQNVAENL